jgi:hypothetical protein
MDAGFSPRATLWIALLLLGPEVLRQIGGSFEPFPAVLLPAGAGKLRLPGGKLTMKHTLVEARRDGAWSEVDRARLLAPLPVHYFGEVVRAHFGFHDNQWHGTTAPPPRPSATDLLETKRWLRARLQQLGFEAHALRVVEERYVLVLPSGARGPAERLSEKLYELD